MKVLFVNPYITDFTAYDMWLRPLGLYYLAAAIRSRSDAEVYCLDALDRFQDGMERHGRADGRGKYPRAPIEKPLLYRGVPRSYSRYGIPLPLFQQRMASMPEPDVIMVTSLMTYWLDGLRFTLNILKQRFPRARVVLGGLLPTLAPLVARALPQVDHCVAGKGEAVAVRLLRGLGAKITAPGSGNGGSRSVYPAVDLCGTQDVVPLLTARGCPGHCRYCASGLLNPVFRERRPSDILAEIKQRRERFHSTHFIIFDDALLINKKQRFLPVFSRLPAAGAETVRFHTPNGLHAREIDRETAMVMRQAGFRTLRLSFEALNANVLRHSDGKVTRGEMERAVRCLEQAGYPRGQLGAYLLFGYPGQTFQDMEASLSFISEMGLVPHLAVFSPVPGTAVFLDLQRRGILSTSLDPLETNKTYFLYAKSGFSHDEILAVKERAVRITRANGEGQQDAPS
jgi:radical SAM superfamily enzyme YgiQ (UPF0313 family)